MIKCIVFDLGGVVLTNDDTPLHLPLFLTEFGITEDDAKKGWLVGWPRLKIGLITEKEFWKILLQEAGSKKIDVERAEELWRQTSSADAEIYPLLDQLKKKYRLAVLSNISKEHLDYKTKQFKLEEYFNPILASGYEGVSKPDVAFYEKLFSKLQLQPSECLFVDDRVKNTIVSNSLGMDSIVFQNIAQLRTELIKRKLLEG